MGGCHVRRHGTNSVRSHLHAWNFAHLDANVFRSKQVSGDMWIVNRCCPLRWWLWRLQMWCSVRDAVVLCGSRRWHTWNFAHLRTYHMHRSSNESGPPTLWNNRSWSRQWCGAIFRPPWITRRTKRQQRRLLFGNASHSRIQFPGLDDRSTYKLATFNVILKRRPRVRVAHGSETRRMGCVYWSITVFWLTHVRGVFYLPGARRKQPVDKIARHSTTHNDVNRDEYWPRRSTFLPPHHPDVTRYVIISISQSYNYALQLTITNTNIAFFTNLHDTNVTEIKIYVITINAQRAIAQPCRPFNRASCHDRNLSFLAYPNRHSSIGGRFTFYYSTVYN